MATEVTFTIKARGRETHVAATNPQHALNAAKPWLAPLPEGEVVAVVYRRASRRFKKIAESAGGWERLPD